MKKHRHFHHMLWGCFFIGISVSFAQTDNVQTSEGLRSAIEHKSFSFLVKSVTPLNGISRHMEPGSLLMINGDLLISRLPYFGRVSQYFFQGENDLLDFESHQFDYQIKARKKGGWKVTIRTKDQLKQRQLIFAISPNGFSTLNVISNDLDPNSYNGTIKIQEK